MVIVYDPLTWICVFVRTLASLNAFCTSSGAFRRFSGSCSGQNGPKQPNHRLLMIPGASLAKCSGHTICRHSPSEYEHHGPITRAEAPQWDQWRYSAVRVLQTGHFRPMQACGLKTPYEGAQQSLVAQQAPDCDCHPDCHAEIESKYGKIEREVL